VFKLARFNIFTYLAILLPLFAFTSTLLLTLYKDFNASNHTHCAVYNFLPSLSACISRFEPQTTIWIYCMVIDTLPRSIISYSYYRYYYSINTKTNRYSSRIKYSHLYSAFIYIAFGFHFVELLGLVGLSVITSDDNFEIHSSCFIIFLLSSIFYMILTILSYMWPRHSIVDLNNNQIKSSGNFHQKLTQREIYSRNLKISTFSIFFLSLLLSLYFYIRHNTHCEAYIYTLFSFFEYLTILSNIFYHSIVVYDLKLY
jgi:post-GPI attachment to proteins factor 2